MILQHISRQLDEIIGLLHIIIDKENKMTQATDNLVAAVKRETDVTTSVTTLISGLAAQIKATSDDPQVQQLADQINSNSDTLASAVTANTPAQGGQPTPSQPPSGSQTA